MNYLAAVIVATIVVVAITIYGNSIKRERAEEGFRAAFIKQKKTVQTPSRLEVNAAIEKLINREDFIESATVIVNFGFSLPEPSTFSFESRVCSRKENGSVVGHTQEQGNVSIKTTKEEMKERSLGIRKERVGYFKLWKPREGRIFFYDFWKSDVATRNCDDEEPDVFVVDYDQLTLEPTGFGRCGSIETHLVSLSRVSIVYERTYIEFIWGKTGRIKLGHGINVDMQH